LEATQDGWQRRSRWTMAARFSWTAAAAMDNSGAMGGRMEKQLRWAMGRWQCNGWPNWWRTIASDAEAAQWEVMQDGWQ
jgi:hypothetical protein